MISVHVSPPSVDLNSPLPGPPLDIVYSRRNASHSAANMIFGLLRIDRDVDRGGLVVAEQRALPRLAAVGALVDAALLARRAQLAERRDEHDVRVGRMDADLRDDRRVSKPTCVHVLPASVDL